MIYYITMSIFLPQFFYTSKEHLGRPRQQTEHFDILPISKWRGVVNIIHSSQHRNNIQQYGT